jgi:arylsulfatase A-like enzyme/tetratricopeptide (TPR) repeat protein
MSFRVFRRFIRFVVKRSRLTVLALAAGVLACRPAPAIHRQPGLNVLLVTIDTLRADAIGAYGNGRASTPTIDRLAEGGVRFSAAHAHTVVTLPSHANILSGLYPTHHGVHENSGFRLPQHVDTLASMLHALGYRTGAFVSAFPLDRRFGLDRGFDVYDDRYGKGRDRSAFHVAERAGTETVAVAQAWIANAQQPATSNQQPALSRQPPAPSPQPSAPSAQPPAPSPQQPATSPWFAWIHLYEPHFPYAPPEPFRSRFASDPYLGEVAAADAALAPLLDLILRDGSSGRTLVVLTGDHGEARGEHGETTHGLFAYEGTLHVPLIVFAPRLLAPGVVDQPVRHVDILPTILDALGARVPSAVDGRSLLDEANGGRAADVPTYFESLSASLNRGWAPLYGVVRGSMKYIDLPMPELYDLAADASEEHNLAPTRPGDVGELQHILQTLRADERATARVSESAETRERLRSLGYASATAAPKTRFTDADDPKRLVAVDRAIEDVVSQYQRGDLAAAIAAAERVQRDRPDMPIALVHLAFLYNEAGHHAAAVKAALRALELNPSAEETAALAGAYLTEAGRAREAVERLAPYVSQPSPDVDVLVAYGVALAEDGRPRDALAAFERARVADPTNGLPLADIATVYLKAGDAQRAQTAFEEALTIDPSLARAHNGLGVIAAQKRDYMSAIEHWRRAVTLDPHDYQTLYNLGDLLVQLGRSAEARPYWERYVREAPPALEHLDLARVRRWLAASSLRN